MELSKARELAEVLMTENGLFAEDGWTFEYDDAVRRFGSCDFKTKTITLSRELAQLNEQKRVEKVILHEIAHALAGPQAHHGPAWRAIAIRLGDDGARCYPRDTIQPPARFEGTCPTCHKTVQRVTRKRGLACAGCCKKGGKGYDSTHRFVWKRLPKT